MKLYDIPESTLLEILENRELSQGKHEIIEDVSGIKFPVKMVIVVEGEIITVITAYPLKKRRKNERILR